MVAPHAAHMRNIIATTQLLRSLISSPQSIPDRCDLIQTSHSLLEEAARSGQQQLAPGMHKLELLELFATCIRKAFERLPLQQPNSLKRLLQEQQNWVNAIDGLIDGMAVAVMMVPGMEDNVDVRAGLATCLAETGFYNALASAAQALTAIILDPPQPQQQVALLYEPAPDLPPPTKPVHGIIVLNLAILNIWVAVSSIYQGKLLFDSPISSTVMPNLNLAYATLYITHHPSVLKAALPDSDSTIVESTLQRVVLMTERLALAVQTDVLLLHLQHQEEQLLPLLAADSAPTTQLLLSAKFQTLLLLYLALVAQHVQQQQHGRSSVTADVGLVAASGSSAQWQEATQQSAQQQQQQRLLVPGFHKQLLERLGLPGAALPPDAEPLPQALTLAGSAAADHQTRVALVAMTVMHTRCQLAGVNVGSIRHCGLVLQESVAAAATAKIMNNNGLGSSSRRRRASTRAGRSSSSSNAGNAPRFHTTPVIQHNLGLPLLLTLIELQALSPSSQLSYECLHWMITIQEVTWSVAKHRQDSRKVAAEAAADPQQSHLVTSIKERREIGRELLPPLLQLLGPAVMVSVRSFQGRPDLGVKRRSVVDVCSNCYGTIVLHTLNTVLPEELAAIILQQPLLSCCCLEAALRAITLGRDEELAISPHGLTHYTIKVAAALKLLNSTAADSSSSSSSASAAVEPQQAEQQLFSLLSSTLKSLRSAYESGKEDGSWDLPHLLHIFLETGLNACYGSWIGNSWVARLRSSTGSSSSSGAAARQPPAELLVVAARAIVFVTYILSELIDEHTVGAGPWEIIVFSIEKAVDVVRVTSSLTEQLQLYTQQQQQAGSVLIGELQAVQTSIDDLQAALNAVRAEAAELGTHRTGSGPALSAVKVSTLKPAVQLLAAVGQGVCAAVPLVSVCNNPTCQDMSKASEGRVQATRCSACRSVRYCSVACQKQHWKHHKPVCKKLAQAAAAPAAAPASRAAAAH